MMNTLSRMGAVGLLVAIAGCVADAPHKPDTKQVVPKELVPPGYQQSDCHFKPSERQAPQEDQGGGIGGFGGMGSDTISRSADTGGHTRVVHPPVECVHHVDQSKCIDDKGQEHPLQWCKDREAAKHTD